MTSVTKDKEVNIVHEKKKEDDDISHHSSTASMSSPVVEPCCRFPRETVQEFVNISTPKNITSSTISSKFTSSTSVSTTKTEEYSSKTSVFVGERKIDAESSEDFAKLITKKTIEKSEKRTGSFGEDDLQEISMVETPPVTDVKFGEFPTVEKSSLPNVYNPSIVVVPRSVSTRREPPNLEEPPLLLATHLVPSLPITLFEILAEVIEAATGRAVTLLHESRVDRPVAKDIVDIAILPASDDWADGTLLPVSFVFEHKSANKERKPAVYVDLVVALDCMRNVEDVTDLRGYRCAVPDRRKSLGAAGLLFSLLKSKGENPSFFGNILDSDSQIAALRMVTGKQAEVCVVESPVIQYHRNTLFGADKLHTLASLGPLPPYRIMLNKKLNDSICAKIKKGLLTIDLDEVWMEKLRPFGVIAFAEYSEDRYYLEDVKNVVTSVPYY